MGKARRRRESSSVRTTCWLPSTSSQAKGDAAIQQKIDGYITKIDALLAPAGLSYAGTVAETDFDLTFPYFQETLLGNLVTDAYLATYNAIYTAEPAVAAFETGGFIRDPLLNPGSDDMTIIGLRARIVL